MGRTILVVDDNPDNLLTARALLEECFPAVSVLEARDGASAIMTAKSAIPDAVLLDVIMPGMDGFEACASLKKDSVTAGIPVVMLTALGESRERRLKALEVGADGFLAKPIDSTELVAQLNAMFRIRDAAVASKSETARLERLVEERTEELARGKTSLLNLLEDLKKENEAFRATAKELHASEILIKTVMDNLPVGIAIITNGEPERFDYVNERFCSVYRTTREAIADEGFWQSVYPDPAQRDAARLRLFGALRGDMPETGRPENEQIDGTGGSFWVSSSVIHLPDSRTCVSTAMDVSEQVIAQRESLQSLERVRRTLESVINAMSITVETRDPYTAGHQRRVADLSRAVALKLGLEKSRVDGLWMAAKIHDLGKISLPAEILSMPRKLTDIEFSLVKTHSRVGYEILKDIDFPWPIARMVLEHHERLDGTGYPGRIGGKDILLESQILSIADIVEAIASHRPYRPALGVAVALEEISAMSGTALDSDVVNACTEVLSSGGFSFV